MFSFTLKFTQQFTDLRWMCQNINKWIGYTTTFHKKNHSLKLSHRTNQTTKSHENHKWFDNKTQLLKSITFVDFNQNVVLPFTLYSFFLSVKGTFSTYLIFMKLTLIFFSILQYPYSFPLFHVILHPTFINLPIAIIFFLNFVEIAVIESLNMQRSLVK